MDDIKSQQTQRRQISEAEERVSSAAPRKKSRAGKKTLIVRAVTGLVLLGAIVFGVTQYMELQDIKKNPDALSQEQVNSLTEKVGKLIDIPQDEQPTIATVQDKDKLKEQPFFAGAENGDKLLIYTKAQRAIIYREDGNKLINVGPVTLDTPVTDPAANQSGIEENPTASEPASEE